jgi:5-methylthioadenosine/S-adenosylhomocysteine deaminase
VRIGQRVLLATVREQRVGALTASDALALATLGGARALRMDAEIGSLDVGKSADLAAFPLGACARGPTHDPVAAAVLALAGTPAAFVAVAGRTLVREAVLLDADRALAGRVQRAANRLRDWLATPEGARASVSTTPNPGS